MRYVFGDCTLDTERYELWRAGTLVKLRPKVFDVLAYLLAHRERVVSKQELLEQLWPKQFVGEATLNTCIQAARQAVGDAGQAQRVILTLHGRGYRFVADVEVRGHMLRESARPLSPTTASQLELRGHVLEALSSPQERSLVTSLAAPRAENEPLTSHVLEAEHKPVTVLSCGLAEATTVAARLGAEAMHRLMQAFFAMARQVMQRYGGTLTHVVGDGFLALFGAPMAQEDHARRAVLAAVELHQTWQEQQKEERLVLLLCNGVHSGAVVVGRLGEDAQRLYTAVGETIDLASRLRQLAAPSAILISATTQQLVQDEVQVDDGGTVNAAETTAAMPVYTVRRIAQRRAGVPGRRGRAWSRFVGRTRELAILHERLAYAAGGEGQVIGIAGEPGIGKSRLLFEFRQSLSGRPVRYYEGHCLAYGNATPYLPVRDLLRQVCGITEADGPEAITAKVQRSVQEAGVTSAEEPLLLFQLLDVPLQGERIAEISPPARRSRTFALLRQVFVHHSQRQPLVLAVENAHWIDATSEAWLTTLAERLPSAAILLLVTYRPGYHPSWLGQSAATQMALPRLTPRDSLTVVQSILPTKPLSEAVRQEMVSKAAGNPFFLEELAWTIREHDAPHPPPFGCLPPWRRSWRPDSTDCLRQKRHSCRRRRWSGRMCLYPFFRLSLGSVRTFSRRPLAASRRTSLYMKRAWSRFPFTPSNTS
jgi:class 3 adenylate cyclase